MSKIKSCDGQGCKERKACLRFCPVAYGARHAKHAQGLLLRKAEWERLPDND